MEAVRNKITVDVYAHWSLSYPRYRIYLNDELYTERDFIWPGHDTYIREHLHADLLPGEYLLRVENVTPGTTVELKNLSVENTNPGINIAIDQKLNKY